MRFVSAAVLRELRLERARELLATDEAEPRKLLGLRFTILPV